jgi:hypothetical protein
MCVARRGEESDGGEGEDGEGGGEDAYKPGTSRGDRAEARHQGKGRWVGRTVDFYCNCCTTGCFQSQALESVKLLLNLRSNKGLGLGQRDVVIVLEGQATHTVAMLDLLFSADLH